MSNSKPEVMPIEVKIKKVRVSKPTKPKKAAEPKKPAEPKTPKPKAPAKRAKKALTKEDKIKEIEYRLEEVTKDLNDLVADQAKLAQMTGWQILPEIVENALEDIKDEIQIHKADKEELMKCDVVEVSVQN